MFARTYNADLASQSGPLGNGWTHNYNMYVLTDTTTSEYKVYQENGSVAPFPITGTGTGTTTHYVRVLADLSRNANSTFVFTRTHGLDVFYFHPVDSTNVAKLYQIKDRNGYTTTLTYDNQGRLYT